MTLIGDLVRDAASSSVPVQELLRRLKVIAARSRTAELGTWVEYELSGYPTSEAVPEYRGPFEVPVRGQFANPAGVASNLPIAPVTFPKEYRNGLFNVTFTESVAELDHVAATNDDGVITAVWPDNAIALTQVLRQQGKIRMDPFSHLVSAHRAIPRSFVVGVLNAVRNRILDLALSFEEIVPSAGEAVATPEQSARMLQVFHTNIYGSQVAVGSTNVTQVRVTRGDEEALLLALASAGVDSDSLEELKKALAEDRENNGGTNPTEPGSAVSRWWTRWGLKGATAAGVVASGAMGDLVAQALSHFFGLT